MELSEQQYNQVVRYVEGEMEAVEKQAFEAALIQNSALVEEVEGYKEIRSVGASVEQKLSGLYRRLNEENSRKEEVERLLQQARQQWERQLEEEFRQQHGLAVLQGKVRTMYMRKWLAAAVVIGFICLGSVLWWNQHKEKDEQKIVVNPKEPDTGVVVQDQKSETTIPSTEHAQQPDKGKKDKSVQEKSYQVDKVERETLYAHNFKPDVLPEDKPDALSEAVTPYESGVYQEAIAGYKKILADPQVEEEHPELTRDDHGERELTQFYAHYYLAQSYLAINKTAASIRELKEALKESPTIYWKGKAEWYLALAYLKTGQLQSSKTLLQQIINNDPSGEYGQKALVLIRKLKKK